MPWRSKWTSGWIAALAIAGLIGMGSATALLAAPPGGGKAASSAKTPEAPVDLNTANVSELIEVPGIGKSLAQRIVDFREKNGPFGRVEDLLKVQGIGEKSLGRGSWPGRRLLL